MRLIPLIGLIIIASCHLLITLPSLIYHGLSNLYYRCITPPPSTIVLKDKNVIVFVHGRGGHHSNFVPLINNIKPKISNRYYLRTVDLGDTRNTSIDEDMFKLKGALDIYPDCAITLVGLSKGGVDTMRYVTYFNMDTRIERVITISSPLRGTRITGLLSKESITNKELGYRSKITRHIKTIGINIPVYHIVPTWDHLIIPTSSAYYRSTEEERIYYYTGLFNHVGITYSKDVAIAIVSWIPPL